MNAQQKNNLLEIKNLTVSSAGKTILKGLDMGIPAGQIHVLMGPNGSGKSTLSKTIMGADDVEIIKGRIYFKSKRINELSPEERAIIARSYDEDMAFTDGFSIYRKK